MASVYTDDARILPPNEPMISGRAAIEDFWQNFLNQGEGEAILDTVSVEIKGDTLIEIGAYSLEIKKDTHVILWAGMSERAVDTIQYLRNEGYIKFLPCSPLVYLYDGECLTMPLAKRKRYVKKDHWLPVQILRTKKCKELLV